MQLSDIEKAWYSLLSTPNDKFNEAAQKALNNHPNSALINWLNAGQDTEANKAFANKFPALAAGAYNTIAYAFARDGDYESAYKSLDYSLRLHNGLNALDSRAEIAEMEGDYQKAFNNQNFRVYTGSDHVGVEIAGSLKNVVALAAGIADGLELGDNTKAALMTRGLAEMSRLGVAMGAKAATFSGLAGMGDLVVTCMSKHSRNRGVGERLGKGEKLEAIQESMDMVAEGVVTAESALGLAKKHQVEMPICEAFVRRHLETCPIDRQRRFLN